MSFLAACVFWLYILFGMAIACCFRREWAELSKYPGALKHSRPISPLLLLLPLGTLLGVSLSAWLTYLLARLLANFLEAPLFLANIVFCILALAFLCLQRRHLVPALLDAAKELSVFFQSKSNLADLGVFLGLLGVSTFLNFGSFDIDQKRLSMALSVTGDFNFHLTTIRTFSFNSNIPTEYAFFANGPNRYHFLFYFLCGNLEYLGLPLDWAINLPSTLGLAASMFLLWHLSLFISGSRVVGILTLLFFLFRSSFSVWITLAQAVEEDWGLRILELFRSRKFLASTFREDWGIYSLNPLINQKHLSFSLGICYLLLHFAVSELCIAKSKSDQSLQSSGLVNSGWKLFAALGLLLGILSVMNGALFLALGSVLGLAFFFAKHRLQFALMGIIGASICVLSNQVFLGQLSPPSEISIRFGFLAPTGDFSATLMHYVLLLGIFPLVFLVSFFCLQKNLRMFFLILTVPIWIANLFQFVPSMENNHKFFTFSLPLLSISIAMLLERIWKQGAGMKILAALTFFFLTITGIVDFVRLSNIIRAPFYAKYSEDVVSAITSRTSGRGVFLLPRDPWFHPVQLSGRRLYLGHAAVPRTIGYKVEDRIAFQSRVYECSQPNIFTAGLRENQIDYVVFKEPCALAEQFLIPIDLGLDSDFVLYQVPGGLSQAN